ncbi:MAG TPA: ATP-binding protein [Terriglobales bacterium]|nr:ATP-binding protein [Terriglobales bacterium]
MTSLILKPQLMPDCTQGCSRQPAQLYFEIRAEVKAIAPVVDAVTDLARELMGEESGTHLEVALALQEALANAVLHGRADDGTKSIQCWVAYDVYQGITMVVRDPGPGYDPSLLHDPVSPENLHLTHGRGLYLIRTLMDEVHFQNQGAEVHMRKANPNF